MNEFSMNEVLVIASMLNGPLSWGVMGAILATTIALLDKGRKVESYLLVFEFALLISTLMYTLGFLTPRP